MKWKTKPWIVITFQIYENRIETVEGIETNWKTKNLFEKLFQFVSLSFNVSMFCILFQLLSLTLEIIAKFRFENKFISEWANLYALFQF